MRKVLILLVAALASQTVCSQIYVGLRDTKYAYAGYQWDSNWHVQLNHSVFIEHLKHQYVSGQGGYEWQGSGFELQGDVYFGTTYCGSFYDFGINVGGLYGPVKWLSLRAKLNARYDSGFKYKTCYLLGVDFNVTNQFSLLAQYTTIPEYRMSERRVKAGLRFKVKNLQVCPMLSIPVEGDASTVRVLIGFRYDFMLGARKGGE